MSDSDVIIFFDIPGDPAHKAWSPNTWKTRYCLNYKGLAYRTEWVEFPDIAAVCTKYGAAPTSTTADGAPYYTLPVIYDPATRTAVADSDAIARYLDAAYPATRALLPAGTAALQAAVLAHAFPAVGAPLFANIAARVGACLPPRGAAYWRSTREAAYGKRLEEFAGEEGAGGYEARERRWDEMRDGLGKLAEWLGANGPGKDELFMGDRVSYADIQVASILIWARVIYGEDSEEWKRIAGWHGGRWKRLLEYFDQYAAVV